MGMIREKGRARKTSRRGAHQRFAPDRTPVGKKGIKTHRQKGENGEGGQKKNSGLHKNNWKQYINSPDTSGKRRPRIPLRRGFGVRGGTTGSPEK